MKTLLRRLQGAAERANRQFARHSTLRMLRTLCLGVAVMNLIAVLLLVIGAVLSGASLAALFTLTGLALLAFAAQALVLGAVLVLWWLNFLKQREDAELRLSIGELPGALEQSVRRARRGPADDAAAEAARAHLRRHLFAQRQGTEPEAPPRPHEQTGRSRDSQAQGPL